MTRKGWQPEMTGKEGKGSRCPALLASVHTPPSSIPPSPSTSAASINIDHFCSPILCSTTRKSRSYIEHPLYCTPHSTTQSTTSSHPSCFVSLPTSTRASTPCAPCNPTQRSTALRQAPPTPTSRPRPIKGPPNEPERQELFISRPSCFLWLSFLFFNTPCCPFRGLA